ncbi:hypothetical protein PSRA_1272 [Pseudoscardovia radai]|uniref:Uncharacterized protein n=1 Tax=Pseudoscardovia radai TaxID=987066 RepID=A0A261EWI5_9BIFI|nr:hypothetical protein [Pseudoscardovia radai]OZG51230.1 hypothetical protein PSRA_1272 [Pseudoscardovia radai]
MATKREYEEMRAKYEKEWLCLDRVGEAVCENDGYGHKKGETYHYDDRFPREWDNKVVDIRMIAVELDQIINALNQLVALERVRLEYGPGRTADYGR